MTRAVSSCGLIVLGLASSRAPASYSEVDSISERDRACHLIQEVVH
jgi:hypothetical protein